MQKMTDGNDSGTKIKICGLRRREDILAVNEAKPDYCGFIIEFPSSFRSVTADEVREFVKELDPEIRPVGVFVNAPMELVRTLLDDGTLALAQLHGPVSYTHLFDDLAGPKLRCSGKSSCRKDSVYSVYRIFIFS